jgi:hypothetical protein
MTEHLIPAHAQVDHYFEVLAPKLSAVPELKSAMELAVSNPEHAFNVYYEYLGIIDGLPSLSADELETARGARQELAEQGIVVSASQMSVADLLSAVGEKDSIPEIARQSTNPDSEYFAPAIDQLVERMEGGHQLKASGKTPSDGDAESGQVIWGHTLMTDPDALLNFTVCHYLERCVSQALMGEGAEIGQQKDYFLNAMIDAVILDHLSAQQFTKAFNLWSTPKNQGGLGWIVPEMVAMYQKYKV